MQSRHATLNKDSLMSIRRSIIRLPLLLVLWALASISLADSGSDLTAAKQAFETVKRAVTSDVNQLESKRRDAIWKNYYLALEQLQRMEVHHRMMTGHQQDRQAQFELARDEFRRALAKLQPLLSGEKP